MPQPVWELYDLKNDPNELENLAGQPQLAEVERRMREALQEMMFVNADFVPPADSD